MKPELPEERGHVSVSRNNDKRISEKIPLIALCTFLELLELK